MKLEATCVQERNNEYDGKKGHVKERILVLLDTEQHEGREISQTMTYVMSPEESALVPVNGLRMKPICIACDGQREWGGGIRYSGHLDSQTMAPFRPKPTVVPAK